MGSAERGSWEALLNTKMAHELSLRISLAELEREVFLSCRGYDVLSILASVTTGWNCFQLCELLQSWKALKMGTDLYITGAFCQASKDM